MSSPSPDRVSLPWAAWIRWIAAVVFALIAAYLGIYSIGLRTENALQRHDADLARVESQDIGQRLEAERILFSHYIQNAQAATPLERLQFAPLRTDDASARPVAYACWDAARQTGIVWIEQLPALPGDARYEIWLIEDANAAAIPAGVLPQTLFPAMRAAIQPASPPKKIVAIHLMRVSPQTASDTDRVPVAIGRF